MPLSSVLQVVVVVSNKLLYFEVLHMLAHLDIKHEHLDALAHLYDDRECSGNRQRARGRHEGLRSFRSGEARVLVLNLLVSHAHWFVFAVANQVGTACATGCETSSLTLPILPANSASFADV